MKRMGILAAVTAVTALALAAGCSSPSTDNGDDGGTPDGTPSGGEESGASPIVIASGQNVADGLAVDGTSVYWTTNLDGNVMKAPVGGGAAVTLASGQSQPTGIVVDSRSVYWANGDGTIMKAALDGSGRTTLASGPADPDVVAIAVDANDVYWTTHVDGALMSVPISGGAEHRDGHEDGRLDLHGGGYLARLAPPVLTPELAPSRIRSRRCRDRSSRCSPDRG